MPYGDCVTYGPGHYETWAHWRRDRTVEPALRALVRSYEYEDWPRGRIVFDQSRDLFIIYADRKLLTPATIARLETQFQLPEERTEIQSDVHYKSTETPKLPGSMHSLSLTLWRCALRFSSLALASASARALASRTSRAAIASSTSALSSSATRA